MTHRNTNHHSKTRRSLLSKQATRVTPLLKQLLQPPVIAVIVLIIFGQYWINTYHDKGATSQQTQSSQSSKNTETSTSANTAPTFDIILPADKTVDTWTRVSPADSTPAYAFKDTLGEAEIVVTEQELPKDFEEDIPAHIKDLAKSYGATQRIPASSAEAYMSMPRKAPQYVIATKYRVLVLIKSTRVLTMDQWTSYLSGMK